MRMLVLNAGSSSLKFALYGHRISEVARGAVTNLGPDARIWLRRDEARRESGVEAPDHGAAVHAVWRLIADDWNGERVVVHRIVHGGLDYSDAVRLSAGVLKNLAELEMLMPLHWPAARRTIEAAQAAFGPDVASVGVFDTALFRSLPPAAREYALPQRWRAELGVRRYGFHGFAHECLRDAALRHLGNAETSRVITVQLGRGCSVGAFRGTQPVAVSMGFSPLEGLIMPTRSGSLDAAAALYLMSRLGVEPGELLRILNEESGLLALSGASAEPAELMRRAQAGERDSAFALDAFFHSLHQYVGAYAGLLGGLDAVALGGGVSEHVPEMRRRALDGAAWLGCEYLPADDSTPEAVVVLSQNSSRVTALLVRVDEERLMAEQAMKLVGEHRRTPA